VDACGIDLFEEDFADAGQEVVLAMERDDPDGQHCHNEESGVVVLDNSYRGNLLSFEATLKAVEKP
jgi:hypothetical protein